MKAIVAVLVLAAVASASSIDAFRAWAKTHGKTYTAAEEARRFAIFKENEAIAERLNLENHGATFGANVFADLTNAEFKAMYTTSLGVRQPGPIEVIADDVNEDNDYRSYLPAVKNQASCGSCWAFSAVANMEGQTYLKHGKKVVSISEQQLVSCDTGNSGCNGGWMATADNYAIETGMATEASYPYTSGGGSTGSCKKFTATYTFSSVHDWEKISSDATIIKYLDEYGPLSIALEADRSPFQLYTGGILDSTACGTTLDHGVTLVGYGTDEASGKNFWTVRNSWGASWGEKGYIRLVRGKNMCGMNSAISSIVA
jgi:hypothetical protein